MPGVVAPPDIEADLIAHLRAAALSGVGNVSWRIGGPYPCLRVVRVGGTTDEILRVDNALIQLEVWGDPNVDTSTQRVALASLLGRAEARIVGTFAGSTTATAVYLRTVRVLTRGQWAPDDTTHQQRYFTRLIVAAHAV